MPRKTLAEIIDFLDHTGYQICILDKDFLSYGQRDGRSARGWLVKGVFEHRIKRFPEGFFDKYKISETAIDHIQEERNKHLVDKLRKLIYKNLRKNFVIKPCVQTLEPTRDLIEECYKKLILPYYTCGKSEVEVSCDADGNMKATMTFENPSSALRELIEEQETIVKKR